MAKLSKLVSKSSPDALSFGGINDWPSDLLKGMVPKKPPKIPGATPMPDETQLDVARRRRLLMTLNRSGRDSTILSDASLGG